MKKGNSNKIKLLAQQTSPSLRNLGKSLPKIKKVRKRSPSPGIKLDAKKVKPIDLYNEAMENLASLKNNYSRSRDRSMSKTKRSTANSRASSISASKSGENEPLNESFGNHKTTRRTNASIKNFEKCQEENFVNDNLNSIDITSNNVEQEEVKPIILPEKVETTNAGIIVTNAIPTIIDKRLDFVLKFLDLENLFHLFNSNKLTFNDILFLSREDLIEMGISLVQRNRVLKFSELYKSFGKEYTLDEILDFFSKNKNFVFNSKIEFNNNITFKSNSNYLIISKTEEEKFNHYENNVLSTANFENSIKQKNTNEETGNKKIRPAETTEKINQRSESEEKGSQTELDTKRTNNIKEVPKEEENLNSEINSQNNSSKKINNVFVNNLDNNLNELLLNSNSERTTDLKEPSKITKVSEFKNSSYKNSEVRTRQSKSPISKNNKNLSSMIIRKNNVIQKQFETMSNEVEKFIKNYKDLKEKSEDRKNRLKCLINRSTKMSSPTKSRSRGPEESVNMNAYHLSEFSNSKPLNESRKHLSKLVNSEDLKVEEERNLDEEMNKILNRIQTASQKSLDANSLNQLNRIKSLTNLKNIEQDKNKKLMQIDLINKEIDKLYEIWNEKHNIQTNLNQCSINIMENKRLLRMLEDETSSLNNNNLSKGEIVNNNLTIESLQSNFSRQSSSYGIYQKKRFTKLSE